ncbi:hypothetical protein CMP1-18 [Clavibacter phage CMP1]|uniref:Uncharacterized protein n=1 Tax=Clavibacter phage CMP1 TaxID=686439 RepID=D0U202_9CAUD|nr:hypothetical protein CMP1-18 [Clavibacter phage CMP1]ACY35914.1 hypothetical protein CMP1-18 [Clavibacter phage CMP1]
MADLNLIPRGDTNWDSRQNGNLTALNEELIQATADIEKILERLPVQAVVLLKDADGVYFPMDQLSR